jgi:dephospho-CoA kinase
LAQKTILIGITGGIGAGKSAVAALYARMGYPVFSADTLAREVVEPGSPALDEIRELFGENALLEDGSLNRPWVREKIAHDPELRLKLEAITHPRIQARFRELAKEAGEEGKMIVFYEAPLLFEAKSETQLDAVITVHAPDEVRIQRVIKRDGTSRETVEKLLASQMPQEEKMKRSQFLIENNGDEKALKNVAFAVLGQVRKKLGEKPPFPTKQVLTYAGGAILLLAFMIAVFTWGDDMMTPAPPEPEMRLKAKATLQLVHKNMQAAKAAQGRYPDDLKAAFGEGDIIGCENCLHYIFALQSSCDTDGKLLFYAPSEAALVEDLKGTATSIRQGLDSLSFPCKPGDQGFNAFAAGMSSPNAPLDILTVGEDGEARVVQDGFSTGEEK